MGLKDYLYAGVLIVVILFTSIVTRKLFPKKVKVVEKVYVYKNDTVFRTVSIESPVKWDTFYTQEIISDPLLVDTAAILEDYLRIYEYNDTLIDNDKVLVAVNEKVYTNKLIYREVKYKDKGLSETVVPPTFKDFNRWSLLAGVGTSFNELGPHYVELGLEYNFKKGAEIEITGAVILGKPCAELLFSIPIR